MSTHTLRPAITYATAARAVEIALEVAERSGVRAVVTVVDPAMTPVAFARADGATPHSLETSRRKAATAASTGRPTAQMSPELAVALEHGSGGLLTRIKGGVPLVFEGLHVGGLGVAGGHPDQDAEIAAEVLARLGADPEAAR
ncbi:heme-binding protein [Isoptericola sp. AK164]|uniref:GlcG/HbpS family heme-binding protein n=1 Tax=Isoptericola sp. AK164 TaxID=3024246 RepID=UPI002418B3D4|nr:heme-binding protein [Isoptericola sp. AK164]